MGTVGEAIPGVEIRIADDGEVLARGANRFQGYWQNAKATAAAIDADGWYHTGDLGELSADGFLTFRGRKKDMIALPDGQKVYPEDVEAVLVDDPRLRDATVVGWPSGLDLRVHAVLALDDPTLAEAVIRDANARLGAQQQIRGFTVWPEQDLPKTHTLKVRKFEVVARLDELAAGADERAAPTGAAVQPHPRSVARAGAPVSAADVLPSYIESIASIPAADVRPDARLSSDLNLDSLQRVELLSIIEEELGSFIDDAALDPDATVAELAIMVEAARGAQRQTGIYGWPLSPLVRLVGVTLQAAVMRPLTRIAYRWRVTGLEHLDGLESPVLFTPNHNLHLDNAVIFSSLPLSWRWKLSVAAGAETIYGNRLSGLAASILVNAFPLQREGGVRRSLELLGARLDRGFSILVFPEGKMTNGGPIQPFKSGAGLVAIDGGTPVVPMRLKVDRMSFVDRWMEGSSAPGSWRGSAELIFGAPMWFDADEDPVAATERLEAAVRAL
jgi:long-chain acyl-CoA synthetase